MSLEEARRRIQEAYDTRSTDLDLSGCDIAELPPEIQELTWLEKLWITNRFSESMTELRRLGSELQYLTQLQHLDVGNNQLSELPSELQYLTQLQHLDVGNNYLSVLPSELKHLTQLRYLDVSDNHLSALPSELQYLTQLQYLDVGSNQLSALPSELQYLVQLQYLDVGTNQLSELPQEFFRLTRLEQLDIRDNQITQLSYHLQNFAQLTYLNITGNKLTALPAEIGVLTNLEWLNVGWNRLIALPSEIAALTRLKLLLVSGNQLMVLPPGIGTLTYLESLFANDNQLIELPPEIGTLTQLELLNMSGNQLKALPSTLQYLSKLKSLSIDNNPLNIPAELIPESVSSFGPLFSYLRQLGEDGARPLMEAKLIVVGEGTVGKTSLVKRLLHDRYDPGEAKTEGIAIERWPLPLDDGEVRLNVWDFGGQEIMHATHQFFLTRRSVYLLVINCRASDHENRLDYWLKLVQSFAPESPVIVVGNKFEQHPLDLDQRGLMLKYPQIKAFVATSCKQGAGISDLRAAIIGQLNEMKHIRDVLPLAWWSVKQQLETMQRDYISHERFQELCEQQGIDDPFVQKVLLGLLNDLGTVLSYHDDPRLAETNVLNPEWVTNGVYSLLNHAPLLDQRSGLLGAGELTAILGKYGGRYPATKCHFISEMMEKFELCFRVELNQWLIPDLLPREEPDTGAWDEALHFVYRYPVLPGSIISRFIVRFQHAIDGALRWRTGVVLRSGANRAIVKADQEDARIDIRIAGDPANRRRFLSAIRHTFEQIHASLAGLRPEIEELVPLPGHPDHLIDYQDLLGREEMGETNYVDGRLKQRFPLRQLLDGYESQTERQGRQVKNYDEDPLEHLQALLEIKRGHLRDYELQAAGFGGLHVPPHVNSQIEQLTNEVARIREALERRRGRGGR